MAVRLGSASLPKLTVFLCFMSYFLCLFLHNGADIEGMMDISKAFLLQESSLSKMGSGPSLPTRAIRHRGGADSLHVVVATFVYHVQLLVRTVGPFPLLRSSRQELTV